MGAALYVHLMVYTGLFLFIMRRANVYLVVCLLTRITLHFQRRYASTELQCIKRLALEIMKEYAIWLGMTQVITSQREINN